MFVAVSRLMYRQAPMLIVNSRFHRLTVVAASIRYAHAFVPEQPARYSSIRYGHASGFDQSIGRGYCIRSSAGSSAVVLSENPSTVRFSLSDAFRAHRRQSRLFLSTLDRNEESDTLVDGSYVDYNDGDNDEESSDDLVDSSSSSADQSDDTTAPPSRTVLLHRGLTKAVTKALQAIEKKNASLQRELDKAEGLEATMNRANLIISNLYRLPQGTTSAMVEDWDNGGESIELELNTKEYNSAQEEADALFAMARKMKRGSAVIMGLMEASIEAEQLLNDAALDLEAAAQNGEQEIDEGMVVLIMERLERTSSKTGFQKPSMDDAGGKSKKKQHQRGGGNNARKASNKREPTYRHFTSPSGLKILVGRNRRDNEAICFQAARGDDVWMHARGCPGAHVLLCVRRGSAQPTSEDLQFAADLAAFYSDARTERRAQVTTAEPKHIQKPRGAPPGAVKLRVEGPTLIGRPEDVPDELKAAREESGGAWDEMGYRKLGTRAKNKKRSAAVEKQNQAKRRADKKEKKKRRQRKQDDGGEFY